VRDWRIAKNDTMSSLTFSIARSLLRRLEPERAHRLTLWALRTGLVRGAGSGPDDAILRSRVWDIDFANPVGLAAGFDKNAEAIDAMLSFGFGFVEVGTVTPRPQPGNPRPRLFRLYEDEAVINRFGFNSAGLAVFTARLARRTGSGRTGVVGVNLGKNRETADAASDYVAGVRAVSPFAGYVVINVSSPNTPGLRALQGRAQIEQLVARVAAARASSAPARLPPLLAKVGPDLTERQLADIAEVALAAGLDGLIVGNTTVERPPGLRSRHAAESGGLSGRPLMQAATACLARAYRLTAGRVPIIGCGGIASAADAYAKIRAGASLVQLYTALVFQGPGLVAQIKEDLAARLRADGFRSLADAVGADHR
jgi:dihydroorotate dehydrogenase